MLIRNISDTALLAAVYRARETERADALFRDPFAARLAGDRGEQIARSLAFSEKNAWSWFMRTYLFDQLIANVFERRLRPGGKSCGRRLDARPYRLSLPASLKVDQKSIFRTSRTTKRSRCAMRSPSCSVERVRLDLADVEGPARTFQTASREVQQALIISEGLILYLTAAEVGSLATDLAAQPQTRCWLLDLCSPALVRMMQKKMGKSFEARRRAVQVCPRRRSEFFSQFGWTPTSARSLFHAAGRAEASAVPAELLLPLAKSEDFQSKRPWGGACLLEDASKGEG